MEVKSLQLINYRNYKNQTIEFNSGLNILVGNNAQGKTNCLESIFLCAVGKSVRVKKDKDLIMWDEDFSKVSLVSTKGGVSKNICIYLFNNQNKAIKINSIPIKRMGQLMGEFNAIYFCPDDLKLVKESPDERRRFMDMDLSQLNRIYFYALVKYNKILAQRNKLLKTSHDIKVLNDTISIWNAELATAGATIIKYRLDFVNLLKKFAFDAQMYLTNNKEGLEISYTGIVGETEAEIKEKLLSSLNASVEKDFELGYTSVGPHRDDIKLVVNNIDIRHFGSQGQQRTSALSLKLAELEIFHSILGEYPVLLLDDVLSELDKDRQLRLLKKLDSIQTIITCTDFDFDVPHTEFRIENGKLTQ